MNTKVKILAEDNGITKVTTISGATRGDDLFIDGVGHGKIGDIIEVPEFWVKNFESELANRYYGE